MSQTEQIRYTVLSDKTIYTNELTPVSAVPWNDRFDPVTFKSIPIKYDPEKLIWDFGDGTTYTGISAVHVYKWPGEYTISLTMIDTTGEPIKSTETFQITVIDFLPTQFVLDQVPDVINIPAGQTVNPISIQFILSWQNHDLGTRNIPLEPSGHQHWMNEHTNPGSWMPGEIHPTTDTVQPEYTFNLYASGSSATPLNIKNYNKDKYGHLKTDWSFTSANTELTGVPLTSINVTLLDPLTGTSGDYNTYEKIYHKFVDGDVLQVHPDVPGAVFTGLSGNATVYYKDDIPKCIDSNTTGVVLAAELDSLKLPTGEIIYKENLPGVKHLNMEPLVLSNVKPRVNRASKLAVTTTGLNDFQLTPNKWQNTDISFTITVQDSNSFNILDTTISNNISITLRDASSHDIIDIGDSALKTVDQATGYLRGELNTPITATNVYLAAEMDHVQQSGYTTDAIVGWYNNFRPENGGTEAFGNITKILHQEIIEHDNSKNHDNITTVIGAKVDQIGTTGVISNVTILNTGTDQTRSPAITINGPGTGAALSGVFSNETQLSEIIILSGGTGYDSATTLSFEFFPANAVAPQASLVVDNNKQLSTIVASVQTSTNSQQAWAIETSGEKKLVNITPAGNIISYPAADFIDTPGTIVDLKLDSDQNIWLAATNGISLVDKNDIFSLERITTMTNTTRIETDRLDNLFRCDENRTVTKYTKESNYTDSTTVTVDNDILEILCMYDNCIWVLTTHQLLKFDNDLQTLFEITLTGGTYSSLSSTIDNNLYIIKDGDTIRRVVDGQIYDVCEIPGATIINACGDTRGYIWCSDDTSRRIWYVDVTSSTSLTFNPAEGSIKKHMINYTTYPEITPGGTTGQQLVSNGDITGFNWVQKYGYIAAETVSLSGASAIFNIYDQQGAYNLRKQNENHDHTATLKSYALQPWLKDNSMLWDQVMNSIVGDSTSDPNTLGKIIYEKTSNFVSNNNDIDDCNIDALHSMCDMYDIDIQKYNLDYPPSLKRLIDILSLKHKRLYGEFDTQSNTFDQYTDYTNPDRVNLGNEIDFETYQLTIGEKIVAFEKFSKIYNVITISTPLTGELDEHGNIVKTSELTGIVIDNKFNMNEYTAFWGWNLTAPVTLSGSAILDFYTFFKYNNTPAPEQVEGVLNWADEQNTLTIEASGFANWVGNDNIMDNVLEHQLRTGLGLFTD